MSKNLTQRAIKASFMELLNERPLDKIAIKDIVELCGVNRNTFYYHYQDIYALLDDVFEEEAKEIVDSNEIGERWSEGLIQATQYALKNKKAIYHIYHSVNREQLERYLLRVADGLLDLYIREQAKEVSVSEEDRYYIKLFYKHAAVGILLEWLQNGMSVEPEYVIQRLEMLFGDSIHHILEAAGRRNH